MNAMMIPIEISGPNAEKLAELLVKMLEQATAADEDDKASKFAASDDIVYAINRMSEAFMFDRGGTEILLALEATGRKMKPTDFANELAVIGQPQPQSLSLTDRFDLIAAIDNLTGRAIELIRLGAESEDAFMALMCCVGYLMRNAKRHVRLEAGLDAWDAPADEHHE